MSFVVKYIVNIYNLFLLIKVTECCSYVRASLRYNDDQCISIHKTLSGILITCPMRKNEYTCGNKRTVGIIANSR